MTRNPYLADYAFTRQAGRQVAQRPTTRRMVAQTPAAPRPVPDRPARQKTVAYKSTTRSRRQQQRKKRRLRQLKKRAICAIMVLLLCVVGLKVLNLFKAPDVDGSVNPNDAIGAFMDNLTEEKVQGINAKAYGRHPAWEEDFLTPNEYSRPGDSLKKVNNIFVHYTANQGTSAKQNRSYFEQLKDTHERSASAHFIIGYDGEIVQCIPLDEIAYAVQSRNEDSISIECCYKADDGSFTQETYDSLIQLLKWLTETYGLSEEDILRHYDCGGKKCPLYYTEHEDAWERLKQDVKEKTF